MKVILASAVVVLFAARAFAQKAPGEDSGTQEPLAVAEFGGAAALDVKGGRAAAGYSVAFEVTPVENWLELEFGATPVYGANYQETDVDVLFKKPWTFSPKFEFMLGIGLAWDHTKDHGIKTNVAAGEAALDFMFWPSARHRFGWYLEPGYDIGLSRAHDESIGITGGLLIGIP